MEKESQVKQQSRETNTTEQKKHTAARVAKLFISMKNITKQYQDLLEGKMSRDNFMRNVRREFPQWISPVNSFTDAVNILKSKRIINENTDSHYKWIEAVDRILTQMLDAGEIDDVQHAKATKATSNPTFITNYGNGSAEEAAKELVKIVGEDFEKISRGIEYGMNPAGEDPNQMHNAMVDAMEEEAEGLIGKMLIDPKQQEAAMDAMQYIDVTKFDTALEVAQEAIEQAKMEYPTMFQDEMAETLNEDLVDAVKKALGGVVNIGDKITGAIRSIGTKLSPAEHVACIKNARNGEEDYFACVRRTAKEKGVELPMYTIGGTDSSRVGGVGGQSGTSLREAVEKLEGNYKKVTGKDLTSLFNPMDKVNPYEAKKGIAIEMGMQYKPIPRYFTDDFNPESLAKATKKVISNLQKDPAYYTNMISQPTEERTNMKQKPKELKVGPDGGAKIPGFSAAPANTKDNLSKKEKAKGNPDGVKMMKENAVSNAVFDRNKNITAGVNKIAKGDNVHGSRGDFAWKNGLNTRWDKATEEQKAKILGHEKLKALRLPKDLASKSWKDIETALPAEMPILSRLASIPKADIESILGVINEAAGKLKAEMLREFSALPQKQVRHSKGSKVATPEGRMGTIEELTHDGTATVVYEDGSKEDIQMNVLKKPEDMPKEEMKKPVSKEDMVGKIKKEVKKMMDEMLYKNKKTGSVQSFNPADPTDQKTIKDPQFNATFTKAE